MKDEAKLKELLEEYQKEYIQYVNEYDILIEKVKNKEIPDGKEESRQFHIELKNIDHSRILSKAKIELLNYILEI